MTQKELKQLLHYNPDTGIFTRLIRMGKYDAGTECTAKHTKHDYITITLNQVRYQAHRLAFLYMTGKFPPAQVDHINRIRNDNRWCNLRLINKEGNAKNSKKRTDNTSKICGVNLYKRTGRWTAYINHNKKRIHLGTFKTKDEAIKARKEAEIKYNYHPNHGI